jgi:hypothetical protein
MLFRETVIAKWENDAKYLMHFVAKYRFFYGSFPNILEKQLLCFLEQTIAKLCAAGCAVTKTVQVHVSNTLKSIYCAYFHSVIIYGIICGCNFSKIGKIFILHKKGILLMVNAPTRTSSLFKQLQILPPVLFQFKHSH